MTITTKAEKLAILDDLANAPYWLRITARDKNTDMKIASLVNSPTSFAENFFKSNDMFIEKVGLDQVRKTLYYTITIEAVDHDYIAEQRLRVETENAA